jgi:hypothetical protein
MRHCRTEGADQAHYGSFAKAPPCTALRRKPLTSFTRILTASLPVCPGADKGVAVWPRAAKKNETGKCSALHHPTSHEPPSAVVGPILDGYARWHAQLQLITSSLPNSKYFPEQENPESSIGEKPRASPLADRCRICPRNRYVFGSPRQRSNCQRQRPPALPHGRAPRLHLRTGAQPILLRPVLWAELCSGGADHRSTWRRSLSCVLFNRCLLIIHKPYCAGAPCNCGALAALSNRDRG